MYQDTGEVKMAISDNKSKFMLYLLLAGSLIMVGCSLKFTGEEEPEYKVLVSRPDRIVAMLPNRLVVVIQKMEASPVVSAQVRVETGSIFEQEYSGAGISHFLEHLLSGGTTGTRSESQSNAILGKIGAQKNAATGLDSVFYYINTTSEHSSTAIELLSDWMLNSTIPEEEFQREREVIQQEFSMGEGDPGRILWRLTQQARYSSHPARHPTIGYINEFMNITRSQLIDFYNRMYAPNNMVFSVAGYIDPSETLNQIAALWKETPARPLPEISFPVEPELREPRQMRGYADISRPRIRLAWPGTRLGEEYDYALDLLADILGSGETSRLNRIVRDRQGLATAVNAYNLSFSWGEGFFGIDAEASGSSPEKDQENRKLIESLLEQVEILKKEKVSTVELERAKRNVLSDVLNSNQTVQETASRLAGDILDTGNPDYLRHYLEAIRELTAEDLKKAANAYLNPQKLITVELMPQAPDKKPQPLKRTEENGEEDYLKETAELDNSRLIKNLQTSFLNEDEYITVKTGPYRLHRLENNLKIITQHSNLVPSLAGQLYFRGGLLAEEEGKEGLASSAAAMMTRGTGNYTAEELAEKIENMGADLNAGSGYNTDYIRGRALSEDWEQLLELMAEVLLNPVFPEEEWEKMQPRIIASINRQNDRWYGELTSNFRREYFPGHPWAYTSAGSRSVVENLTSSQLKDFHFKRINPADMVIAVTGKGDMEKIKLKIKELFQDLQESSNSFPLPHPSPPEYGLKQVKTSKPLTAVKIGLGPSVDRAHKDFPALALLSSLISDFPSGWLQQALRGEGAGLAYAAWARMVTGLVPGYFEITFNTSASFAPLAINKAAEVIERARSGEVEEEEIERAAAAVLFNEFFYRQSNSQRAAEAALDRIYGLNDPDGKKFREEIKEITPAQIHRAAGLYFKNALTLIMSMEEVDPENISSQIKSGRFNSREPGK